MINRQRSRVARSKRTAVLAAAALMPLMSGCGDDTFTQVPGTAPPTRNMPGTPAAIEVQPAVDTVRVIGATVGFEAVVFGADDQLITGVPITWISLDPLVADVVETTGVATAASEGSARILAQAGNITKQALLVVEIG